MDFPKSKFSFTVKSTSARPPKTTEPELTIIAGVKGKFKANEALSKLMGAKPGDYFTFINTEDQVAQMKEAYAAGDAEVVAEVDEMGGVDALVVQWGVAKGWELCDVNGIPLTIKKPLTNKEAALLVKEGQVDEEGKAIAPDVPAHKGSRLSTKMKEVKMGMILEGTDSTNAPALRDAYPDDKHVVYSVNSEAIPAQFDGGDGNMIDVPVYLIAYAREEDKIERTKAE